MKAGGVAFPAVSALLALMLACAMLSAYHMGRAHGAASVQPEAHRLCVRANPEIKRGESIVYLCLGPRPKADEYFPVQERDL